MVPFKETATSKAELDELAKQGFKDYQDKTITKNDFLIYFGFTHGEAIKRFYPDNNYDVLLQAGFNTGSEAYFSAGINAWCNLNDGKYNFPSLICDYTDELIKLRPGDTDGSITVIDEDRLCFFVNTEHKGTANIRTISKDLLKEFILFEKENPSSNAETARDMLSGKTKIDKFEYGYNSTLLKLAKLNKGKLFSEYVKFKHILEYFCAHLQYIVSNSNSISGYDEYLKPHVEAGTFKKSGQGWKGDKIQNQIKEWENYKAGIICINVYGSSFQSYATYLHWKGTGFNISANWNNDKIESLQCVKYEENSKEKWTPQNTKFTLSELSLYDGKEPNENVKALFDAFLSMLKKEESGEKIIQRILYGAPGTGKSFSVFEAIAIHSGTIKEGEKLSKEQRKALEESKNVFRTTFHPDYDYAQFVGCYKPTKSSNRILSQEELVKIFNDMTEIYPLSKIGYQYWESFEKIDETDFLKDCGKESQGPDLRNGIELGKKFRKDTDKITYEFTPQVFTQALIKAYKNLDESVYLVIEEINRGNCAQIFGDIFQLLDRNSETGESEYSINVDEDLRKYLEEKCPAAIKDGKIKLPRNFNIIATMNTSDQSLFPMDSAFKRRWDWEYVAIKNENKGWTIKIDEKNNVDWWEFLEKINEEISDFTTSEDKQLGYYFCKPDIDQTTISAKKFVGKVIFYLWNDLFKDYGFEHNCCKDAKGKTVLFAKFYDSAKTENGAPVVNTDVLKNFFSKLNPEWIKKNPQEEKIEEQ